MEIKVMNFDSKIQLGTHFRVVAQNQTYSRYAAYSPWVIYIDGTEYISIQDGQTGNQVGEFTIVFMVMMLNRWKGVCC